MTEIIFQCPRVTPRTAHNGQESRKSNNQKRLAAHSQCGLDESRFSIPLVRIDSRKYIVVQGRRGDPIFDEQWRWSLQILANNEIFTPFRRTIWNFCYSWMDFSWRTRITDFFVVTLSSYSMWMANVFIEWVIISLQEQPINFLKLFDKYWLAN